VDAVSDLTARLAVVTGAATPAGRRTVGRLAAAGATVVMAVPSSAEGERARRQILTEHPLARLLLCRLDLAHLESVRDLSDGLLAAGRPLDILVHHPSRPACPPSFRRGTADGFELLFGTQVLGPFALTVWVLPLLLGAEAARVVTVTDAEVPRTRIRFDDLQWRRRRYHPRRADEQAGHAGLLVARHLADLVHAEGLRVSSMVARTGPGPHEGRAVLYAAADPSAVNGWSYAAGPELTGRAILAERLPAGPRQDATARRLWAAAEDLTGARLDDALAATAGELAPA